jgi:hypothetical protein
MTERTDIKGTEDLLQGIAEALDATLNAKGRTIAFVVLLAPFEAPEGGARVNYVSNANREDIHSLLKEMIDRWDEPPELAAGGMLQ